MKPICALLLLSLLAACSVRANPYAGYPERRKEASAICEKLGYLVGSPEFYSCVGIQYTRLKQEEME